MLGSIKVFFVVHAGAFSDVIASESDAVVPTGFSAVVLRTIFAALLFYALHAHTTATFHTPDNY